MSELKQKITEDMKSFMRSKDKENLEAIRLLISQIKRKEIDDKIECNDDHVTQIIIKMVKQGKDAQKQFEEGGRPELALKEKSQVDLFSKYLPEALDEDSLNKMIDEAISEVGATSMQHMGAVMAMLKPKCQGRVDMGLLSKQIKDRLSA